MKNFNNLFAATKNKVAIKVLKALLFVVPIIGLASCNKEQPVVNPLDAQLKTKAREIHTFYRDSLNQGYHDAFEAYLPENPIMNDTTNAAPLTRDDFIATSPTSQTTRKAIKFADFCAEYVELENQAKK